MYAKLASWIGDKAWVRPIAARVLPPVDRLLARWGRQATPWPTAILTTVGRRSSKWHRTPLYFVLHDGSIAVIATNFGRADPDWSLNLAANPRCTVELRGSTSRHMARLAGHEEWEPIFRRFVGFYPPYAAYLERAGRDIPIWILEREEA